MQNKYVLSIDQSTQGTKALLFDHKGTLLERSDLPHKQIINEAGWVEHDPNEIYENTLQVVKNLVHQAGICKEEIVTIGLSNQRETALVWEKQSGEPIYHAIVWQCARGEKICRRLKEQGAAPVICEKTGLMLSPYFSAAKIAWVLEEVEGAREKADRGELCCGTMDSWLLYKLTNQAVFKTDFSNASRTQLFNVSTLCWDVEVADYFGIPLNMLPEVCDSDSDFGMTTLSGYLEKPVPIQAILGDSHGALFGQGCHKKGMIKTTYGTGSSIMMNIGKTPVFSKKGLVTSLAWKESGVVNYVLEGNINYTGAIVSWLVNDLKIIEKASLAEEEAMKANPQDTTYLVPAFSGLSAPYWDSDAKATLTGMTRVTGKSEIVKAGLESIAYQITDVVRLMEEESGIPIEELRVDGGPTRNRFLMQFQSDILNNRVFVPEAEELSGIGAAYMAGIKNGIYNKEALFAGQNKTGYEPKMGDSERSTKYKGWEEAVGKTLTGP